MITFERISPFTPAASPQIDDPLYKHALSTYRIFSQIDPSKLNQEQGISTHYHTTHVGHKLTVKINKMGYLITELGSAKPGLFPIQEMIVKASPEFQIKRANNELRQRIIEAIWDSFNCVIEGASEEYDQMRKFLSIRIPQNGKVAVLKSLDDERLSQARLVDSQDYSDLPLTMDERYMQELLYGKTIRPMIALTATKLHVFEMAA